MNKFFQLRGFQIALVIIISAAIGYWFGQSNVHLALKNYKPIVSITSKAPPPGQNLDMKLFYDVLNRVDESYYDKSKINSQKILEGAINGMLASLNDPYTSFFPPARNTDFKTQLAGQFSGIGAELSQNPDNKIVVVAPLDGSPAEKAGIKAGDLILKVNGDDTSGWTVSQAVEKIRGPKGTPVELTVLHDKAKTPTTIKMVRDTIVIKSVTGWVKEFNGKPVAYIRLSQFGDSTDDEWVKVVNSLNGKLNGRQSGGTSGPEGKKPAGVILDLRNNPGGYLNDAVFIASEFLKSGVVVIQEDGTGVQDPMAVSRRGTFTDYPVIVIVNKGSASASEIVAGALRDNGRAKLLGEQSFGDRKSTRLNSSHSDRSRMPSSA